MPRRISAGSLFVFNEAMAAKLKVWPTQEKKMASPAEGENKGEMICEKRGKEISNPENGVAEGQ